MTVIGALACAAEAPIAHVEIAPLPRPLIVSDDPEASPAIAATCAPSKVVCNKYGCAYVRPGWREQSATSQRDGCEAGSHEACVAYGARLALGEGVTYDAQGASNAFRTACNAKNALGCVNLKVQAHASLEQWSAMCDQGVGEACLEAGHSIRFGDAASTHTPGEGARFYQRACDLGIGNGCARIGYHYGTGLAVPRDDHHAYELMSKGCTCGDDTGCSGVAYFLRDGHGVAQDTARAKTIFTRLCSRGVEASCVHLAVMYQKGNGVPVDLARARSLYEQACDERGRDTEGGQGCVELGHMYRDGIGVAVDEQRAHTLYEQACNVPVAGGCYALGLMYRDGRIVTQDLARARTLFDYACDHGESDACDARHPLSP